MARENGDSCIGCNTEGIAGMPMPLCCIPCKDCPEICAACNGWTKSEAWRVSRSWGKAEHGGPKVAFLREAQGLQQICPGGKEPRRARDQEAVRRTGTSERRRRWNVTPYVPRRTPGRPVGQP